MMGSEHRHEHENLVGLLFPPLLVLSAELTDVVVSSAGAWFSGSFWRQLEPSPGTSLIRKLALFPHSWIDVTND